MASDSDLSPAEHYAETIARDQYEPSGQPPAQGHQARATLIAELVEVVRRARLYKLYVPSNTQAYGITVGFSLSDEALRNELLAALASGGAGKEHEIMRAGEDITEPTHIPTAPTVEVWAEEGGMMLAVAPDATGQVQFTITTQTGRMTATVLSYRCRRIIDVIEAALLKDGSHGA